MIDYDRRELYPAYYDVARFGASFFSDPLLGTGGDILIEFELWRATVHNQMVEDITDVFTGGQASLNHDRAIKTEASFDLSRAGRIDPYVDYLAPFINMEFVDGRPGIRSQLGLYATSVPPGTRTVERSEAVIPGRDLTTVLARYAFEDTYNISAGTNYRAAILTIIALAGITRVIIPDTDMVLANDRSFSIGTTILEAANTLLEEIGCYQLAMVLDGSLMSMASRNVEYVEPYRTITDADLMGEVTTQPTDTTVSNVVIVIKDNPSEEPLTAIRRNDDPASPTSTVNLGIQTRVEKRSDLADQAAVNALADRLASEGRTWYQTARLPLLPDPLALMPRQTIDLACDPSSQTAIFNGRWRVRTATMGFSPATAGAVLEVNRVTDRIRGALI